MMYVCFSKNFQIINLVNDLFIIFGRVDELNEELCALIAIAKSEVVLFNFIKARNNSISTNLNEIT
jgi:hypothetical protein